MSVRVISCVIIPKMPSGSVDSSRFRRFRYASVPQAKAVVVFQSLATSR